MSPSWFRQNPGELNLSPFHLLTVEFVEVYNVLFIPPAKDVEISVVSAGSVSPSSAWHSLGYVDFCAGDCHLLIGGVLKKLCHVKDVHFIHVHIFAVAASESNDLGVAKG